MSDDNQDDLTVEEKLVAYKVQKKIQDECMDWAHRQTKILTIAIGLVVAVFGFFGYSTYSDFIEKADKSKELFVKTEKMHDAIEEKTTKLNVNIADLEEKIKHLDIDSITTSVKQFNKEVVKLERSKKDLDDMFIKTKNKISRVERMGNMRINLAIHYQDKKEERRYKRLVELKRKLNEVGFMVYPDNVLNISANRNEIIYYSPLLADEANDISKIIKKEFDDVVVRSNDSLIAGNPNQILIKLKR